MLEEAFKRDPYHVRVSNTLKVLEVLDGYQTLETEHFRIRYYGLQDQLLAKYAAKFLEERYPALARQAVRLRSSGQVVDRDLQPCRGTPAGTGGSARMIGLPYLGTVGACAGKMVALRVAGRGAATTGAASSSTSSFTS